MQFTKLLSILFFSAIILASCSSDEESITQDNPSGVDNKQVLGSSARDLLSDVNFKSLRIEIVSVSGFAPSNNAVSSFKEFLEARLFKPDGIEIIQRTIPSSGNAPFNIDEIAAIENSTRALFNQGDEITVYIYFADGSNEDDEGDKFTLGTAYRNTSIVIYEETLRELSIIDPSGNYLSIIEAATLNHEFSHLLGLVNIGTPMVDDHEDTENGGHCNVSECLMEASIQFNTLTIPQLDAECLNDLKANGGR